MSNVTHILSAIEQGDGQAAEQLLPLVYDELRKLAAARLAQERPGQTLQPTALVHEAYLRLVDVKQVQRWDNQRHFFSAAAESMRRILVDYARKRTAGKRGGGAEALALDEATVLVEARGLDTVDVVAVHEALRRLEALDERQARVVELRVFAGLKNDEIAAVIGMSRTTVKREWEAAKAWLHRELSAG